MILNTRNLPAYVLTNDLNDEYILNGNRACERLLDCNYTDVHKYEGVATPHKGCDYSHLKLLSDTSIKTPFIVFEDDIINLREEYMFQIPDDADALYLGTSRWSRAWNYWMSDKVIYQEVNDQVVQIFNMLCTHAIVYLTESYREAATRCFEYSLKNPYDGVMADQHLTNIQKYYNIYSVNEPIFAQEGRYFNSTNRPIRGYGMTIQESQKLYRDKLQPHHGQPLDDVHSAFEPLNYY